MDKLISLCVCYLSSRLISVLIVFNSDDETIDEPMVRLTEKLAPLMPTSKTTTASSLDTFFFWNSGAEAVEAAIKLARQATGKQNIIVMQVSHFVATATVATASILFV
jgi:4-aminobutyrate aminotransferase-like enzyme